MSLRAIFVRFWPLTAPLRPRLYVTLVLVVIAPVLSTAGIAMFKILIDRVVVPHNFRLFPLIALAYVGITVAQGVVSFADQYLSTWFGPSTPPTNTSRTTPPATSGTPHAPVPTPNPSRFIHTKTGQTIDRQSTSPRISSQKQGRHLLGGKGNKGGTYWLYAANLGRQVLIRVSG